MPNRVIKDSICESEKLAELTDFEFRLWVGLVVSADDAGRGDARPAIIKGHVFPLRERVTVKDIDAALHALAAKGCISLYSVDGRSYFWFPSWAKHQRIRDVRPKFPEPPAICQSAADCGELRQTAADCGELRLESNPNTNTNPNTKEKEKAPARHKYGQYGNVLLSDEELAKLKAEFSDWQQRIERLSEYIASSGKSYKNHLATIRAWARKDGEKAETGKQQKTDTLDYMKKQISHASGNSVSRYAREHGISYDEALHRSEEQASE